MSNKSKRVLVFTTAYRPMIGGSEIALEEIIRRLPDIFFDIITPRHKREFRAFESGGNFNIHRVGPGFETAKIIFPVSGVFKAIRLMKDNKYDAIHAYQASYGGGAAWLLKLFYPGSRFILTLQEGKDMVNQNILIKFFRSLIIKKADVITAISNYLAGYAKRINSRAKFFLISNGIDLDKFQVPSSKLQVNFNFQNSKSEDTKTVISVSRLVPKNGLGDLIKAFHILHSKFKTRKIPLETPSHLYCIQNSKLLIIGDGPLEESLKFKVKSLELEDEVKFAGKVSPDEIPKYLAQADIFVRPSLSEGLGSAFLEAMAASPIFLKTGKQVFFAV